MTKTFIAAVSLLCLAPIGASAKDLQLAQSANGAPCSNARIAYCRSKGLDDNGYGSGWRKNRCSKSPYGPRYEYLVPAWNCLREP